MKKEMGIIFLLILLSLNFGYGRKINAEETTTQSEQQEIAITEEIKINEEIFPDKNLRRSVRVFDKNNDGMLSIEEQKKATYIYLFKGSKGYESVDLQGIGFLKYVDTLSVDAKKVYHISEIEGLEKLKSVEFTKCNNVTELDLLKMKKLKSIYFEKCNNISSLNLSQLENLERVYFEKCNKITTLDLSKSINLKKVSLYLNNLKNIQFPKNNQIKSMEIGRGSYSAVNFKRLPNLKKLSINDCTKTGNLIIRKLDTLKNLRINSNFKTITVKKCQNLKEILIGNNKKTTTVSIKSNPQLNHLEVSIGKTLKKLEVKNVPKLERFSSYDNKSIKKWDASSLKNLTTLYWINGRIKKLKLYKKNKIENFVFKDNNYKGKLDDFSLKKAKYIDITNNRFYGTLNLMKCPKLSKIWCSYNQIEKIDGKKHKTVFLIECYKNKLKEVRLDYADCIGYLYCKKNPNAKIYVLYKERTFYYDKSAKLYELDPD